MSRDPTGIDSLREVFGPISSSQEDQPKPPANSHSEAPELFARKGIAFSHHSAVLREAVNYWQFMSKNNHF